MAQAGRMFSGGAVRLAAAITALWAQPSLAQITTRPPDEEGKPILQWVCVILFAAVVIAIASKNPKRSHQG